MKSNQTNSKEKIDTTRKPLISIVMPVFNAADFLAESIESILNQTYKNFEFIIVDDNSSDKSWKILSSYAKKDKRIIIFRQPTNLGVSETVKKAIFYAKGEFIARMDSDDIALPNRLQKQLIYLLLNRKTVALGGQCLLINKQGKIIGEKIFPTKFKDIYRYIYYFVPLQQPTLMIARKRLPKNFVYYRDGMNTAEEVELIFKLFLYGKVENLPDFLLKYRLHNKNTSLLDIRKTFFLTLISRIKAALFYKYKPSLHSILTNIAQALLILILPKKSILYIYKKIRKTSNIHPDLIEAKYSYESLAAPIPKPSRAYALKNK